MKASSEIKFVNAIYIRTTAQAVAGSITTIGSIIG